MKKQLLLLILFLFIVSCKEIPEEQQAKTLSELQVEACNAADGAETCDTRLAEVGIVLKEDCCQVLGKCCT
jgi:hypothetical protein|tara:strand:+ start:419 stop:631 length:213 start_codon:yes stop_codon:yes gene_type:complete